VILPSFVLKHTQNRCFKESGLDSLDCCINPDHWRNYPHPVEYQYNSRGYRDAEWPQDLSSAVWCFGDSFTAGIGIPHSHTWPQILQTRLNTRTINISMDGASNNWIARKVKELAKTIIPQRIIIQWSFTHRSETQGAGEISTALDARWRELYNSFRDESWPECNTLSDFDSLPDEIQKEVIFMHSSPTDRDLLKTRLLTCQELGDESRRLYHTRNLENNAANTVQCIQSVVDAIPAANVIHSFVPDFATQEELPIIMDYVQAQNLKWIPPVLKLDLGRDGYHYDKRTAESFCDAVVKLI